MSELIRPELLAPMILDHNFSIGPFFFVQEWYLLVHQINFYLYSDEMEEDLF